MRKGLVCSLLVLCSLAAVGQSVPQWKVVKVVHVQGGGSPGFRKSILLLPRTSGFYRATAYLGSSNLTQANTGWIAELEWTDQTGLPGDVNFALIGTGGKGAYTAMNPTAFTVQANTPVIASIQINGPPPNATLIWSSPSRS